MFEIRSTENAPKAVGPYSQAVLYGKLLFTSGQIGMEPKTGELVEGGIEAQAERALKNLEGILKEYNTTLNNVIKTTCFLADMEDFDVFNRVYGRYFSEHKPARCCVAVKALPKGALCEIDAVVAV